MGLRIEDYALIGDTQTAALVGRNGSIDWFCVPRFDSPACFAALLGTEENGRWLLAPKDPEAKVRRGYRPDTMILETEFTVPGGRVLVIDFLDPPLGNRRVDLFRIVLGLEGRVSMGMDLTFRFDYGVTMPWLRRTATGLQAIAGPNAVELLSPFALENKEFHTRADFEITAGQWAEFSLTWFPSHTPPPLAQNARQALARTECWWREWAGRCSYRGPWREAVIGSLNTLKALTFSPTGGIVAAPTTSLPEQIGGVRNWDYRFCWLRDATFTLYALLVSGHTAEAQAWRDWLLRAVAGRPSQLQIMYSIRGDRRLTELELEGLAGYEGSRPVRIGNHAYTQSQLDVYGEVVDCLHAARKHKVAASEDAWLVQKVLADFLESNWNQPDNGIWEVRGPKRHFTHSKIMAWVAFDRSIKGVEDFGLTGPVDRWKSVCRAIHEDICRNGFDAEKQSFVQYYGGTELDASLLMMPLVGFLPANDPRVRGTVAAIERELIVNGLVQRYLTKEHVDGLPPGEGTFLACSFWLADNYVLMGRYAEARALFERLIALRNDVGLLAEEYDPIARRQLGNFPQAFSHVALVNTAHNLATMPAPPHRGESEAENQPPEQLRKE
jgi:GH15 family glucan-1,4-alpha-glucosidase